MFPRDMILVADGTAGSVRAAEASVSIARGTGSRVHVACCVQTSVPTPYPRSGARYRTDSLVEQRKLNGLLALDEMVERISGEGVTVAGTHYREGARPHREIVGLADALGVDLIVVGRREESASERVIVALFPSLGKLADRIYHHARCPVMVVRKQEVHDAARVLE